MVQNKSINPSNQRKGFIDDKYPLISCWLSFREGLANIWIATCNVSYARPSMRMKCKSKLSRNTGATLKAIQHLSLHLHHNSLLMERQQLELFQHLGDNPVLPPLLGVASTASSAAPGSSWSSALPHVAQPEACLSWGCFHPFLWRRGLHVLVFSCPPLVSD